jgi:hypothetical protein
LARYEGERPRVHHRDALHVPRGRRRRRRRLGPQRRPKTGIHLHGRGDGPNDDARWGTPVGWVLDRAEVLDAYMRVSGRVIRGALGPPSPSNIKIYDNGGAGLPTDLDRLTAHGPASEPIWGTSTGSTLKESVKLTSLLLRVGRGKPVHVLAWPQRLEEGLLLFNPRT